MPPTLSIVIPLLNEAESLPELSAWIDKVLSDHKLSYEIIFIDDGSTDNSWEVIREIRKKDERVKAIRFRRNYGKSAALHTGFQQVRGDVVITMDADLQDSPEEIPGLYKMINEEQYDLVSGWKKKRFDPLSKTIPTKIFNGVTRAVSRIHLHDFNCGLKAYKREVVKNIEVYGDMHRYIPVMAKYAGYTKIGEKVVQHQARKYGRSKFGLSRFVNGFLDIMSITFVGKFGKRPMHFFGTIGTIFFIIGFISLLYLTIEKIVYAQIRIAERPLFYFGILLLIVGSQLFLTGFLAEMISRNAQNRNQYHIEDRIGLD